ncbi:hypothetical protein LTR16_006870, partial [Cryomyces antarcticus]
ASIHRCCHHRLRRGRLCCLQRHPARLRDRGCDRLHHLLPGPNLDCPWQPDVHRHRGHHLDNQQLPVHHHQACHFGRCHLHPGCTSRQLRRSCTSELYPCLHQRHHRCTHFCFLRCRCCHPLGHFLPNCHVHWCRQQGLRRLWGRSRRRFRSRRLRSV